MRFIHLFQVSLIATTLLVEVATTQGRKSLLKPHRSRLQSGDKKEKAVSPKKLPKEEVSTEDDVSTSASQDSVSSSASASSSVEHVYHSQRKPSGKISRSVPSRMSASASVSTSASSSASDEQLPAEKGDLGIPEQLMKVRHGVYKGQMAVFVDSQSTENDDGRPSKGGSTRSSRKEGESGADFFKKYISRPTTTTTPTTPRSTSPRNHPPKVKISHHSPSRTIAPTKRSRTRKPTTKKVTRKSTTTTTKATTTTTTRLPIVIRPPPPPRHLELKNDGLENFVMQVPPKNPKSTPSPAKEHNNHSSCLTLGRQCRRHNECCTHHCNWRMGMKCDYQAF